LLLQSTPCHLLAPLLTAVENAARAALVTALRTEAAYVQTIASQDIAMLLSSGFLANSTSKTRTPLGTPGILRIDSGMSTQLNVRLQPVTNARAYEVQVKNGTGGWLPAGIFTRARDIIVDGLTPGNTYTVQARHRRQHRLQRLVRSRLAHGHVIGQKKGRAKLASPGL
jgi:hypothetical protein